MLIHSGDICNQSQKLSKIAPNCSRFLPSQILLGTPSKVVPLGCHDFAERAESTEDWRMMTADDPRDRSLSNDCWQWSSAFCGCSRVQCSYMLAAVVMSFQVCLGQKDNFLWFSTVELQIVTCRPGFYVCYLYQARTWVSSRNHKVSVIFELEDTVACHCRVKVCCVYNVLCRAKCRTLYNTGLHLRGWWALSGESSTVLMFSEEIVDPVVNIVRNLQLG